MPRLDFEREVPFSARQMFDLVSDLEHYPRFIPNCSDMKVSQDRAVPGNVVFAKMTIKFGPVTQAYTSKVTLDADRLTIGATAVDGPFSHLDSLWRFTDETEGAHVHFDIDFNISNRMLAIAAEPAFAAKQKEILEAFLTEARRRYVKS